LDSFVVVKIPAKDSTWENEYFIKKRFHNYLIFEDNTFLKQIGMLGPYNTSVASILLFLCPIKAHYFLSGPNG